MSDLNKQAAQTSGQGFFNNRGQNSYGSHEAHSPLKVPEHKPVDRSSQDLSTLVKDYNNFLHGGKKSLFSIKNYNERKFQSIQQPYTDILINNQKHRENVVRVANLRDMARNQSMTELESGSGFIGPDTRFGAFKDMRKQSQASLQGHTYYDDDGLASRFSKKQRSHRFSKPSQNQNYAKSQMQVKHLLQNARQVLKSDSSAKHRIAVIDRQIVEEQLKQKNFFHLTSEINKLKDQKPEYLRQFFEQAQQMDKSLSETEVDSKKDYDRSRLDKKLWAILEGDRRKKLQALLSKGPRKAGGPLS